ncbi:MAG: dihydroneopterin aldolase [Lentisphaeria bacterium]|nr:dihydroneopterin aldolase [Lentisphaeria bacterium]
MEQLDQITIANLRCTSHIGCKEKERELPQALIVTATVYLDTREAAQSDDLEKTVNYAHLSKTLIRRCEASTCQLIETLAETLAQDCLAASPRVRKTTIKIKKPAGLPNGDYASIMITREAPCA